MEVVLLVMVLLGLAAWFVFEEEGERASTGDAVPEVTAEVTREVEAPLEPAAVAEPARTPAEEPERASREPAASEPEAPEAPMVVFQATAHDADGAPLEGIEMRVSQLDEFVARSDARGELELSVPWSLVADPPSRRMTFVASGPYYPPARASAVAKAPGDVFVDHFVLVRGGRLTGRVVDVAGQGVEGATVVCSPPRTEWSVNATLDTRIHVGWPASAATLTDARGEYELVVAPAIATVAARAQGTLVTYSEQATVEEGRDTAVEDLVLERAPDENLVAGVVLDADGAPWPAVDVQLLTAEMNGVFATFLTDDEGAFAFVTDAGGVHAVRAGRRAGEPMVAYDVPAGTTDLVLRPRTFETMRVEALRADGSRTSSFTVTVLFTGDGDPTHGFFPSEDGAPVDVVVPAKEFELLVRSAAHRPKRIGPYPTGSPGADGGPPRELVVQLEPEVGLSGRVLRDGAPVADALVDVHVMLAGRRGQSLGSGLHDRFGDPYTLSTRTADDGRFALPLQPHHVAWSEGVSVLLHASSADQAFGAWREIPVVESMQWPDVTLDVGPSGSVEGRVTASDGRDLRGLVVAVSRADSHVHEVELDASGSYRFDDLPVGRWEMVVDEPKVVRFGQRRRQGAIEERDIPYRFDVLAGETTHYDFALEPEPVDTVFLDGTFLIDGREPVGWRFALRAPGASTATAAAFGPSGTFSASFGEPGEYGLLLYAPREGFCVGATLTQSIDLVAGRTRHDVRLTTGSILVTGLPEQPQKVEEIIALMDESAFEAEWHDPSSDLAWFANFHCGGADGLVLPQVPAGAVKVARAGSDAHLVLDVRAGERAVLDAGDLREEESPGD